MSDFVHQNASKKLGLVNGKHITIFLQSLLVFSHLKRLY